MLTIGKSMDQTRTCRKKFKYLGTTVNESNECNEINSRIDS